jgi:MFS transporter, Spinster family, sphingosine-1-phosphate transporter
MSPEPPSARDPGTSSPAVSGATFAVVVLTAINLLNYVDRYVPSAVKVLFQQDLHLTDDETSFPLTAFVVVYMVVSPVFGSLADRYSRKGLIAIGVALWSVATSLAALATGFYSFLAARAAVGIGEAAYATISPAILSDFFPPARRNRILSIFYTAIPVGAAAGFLLGGWLGQNYGWRAAFLACGLPGLAVALLVLLIDEPPRGQQDEAQPTAVASWPEALRALARNRPYRLAVAGYAAVTFASGALADWFPTFLVRCRGFDLEGASAVTGMGALIGGIVGTGLGGLLADRLRGRTRQPYFALSAWTMAGATLLSIVALVARDHAAIAVTSVAAQILLWCYNGPINAVIVNAVGADLRVRAVSLSIFCIHLLGDAASPSVVAMVYQATNRLPLAMALVPLAHAIGTLWWLYAWRRAPEGPAGEAVLRAAPIG